MTSQPPCIIRRGLPGTPDYVPIFRSRDEGAVILRPPLPPTSSDLYMTPIHKKRGGSTSLKTHAHIHTHTHSHTLGQMNCVITVLCCSECLATTALDIIFYCLTDLRDLLSETSTFSICCVLMIVCPLPLCCQLVTRTKKIFVGGLSVNTTIEDVKQYFDQFGKVNVTHCLKTRLLTWSGIGNWRAACRQATIWKPSDKMLIF